MSNFIPEMSGHFISTTFGTKSTKCDFSQIEKIASEISKKDPDEIMEFLMIVSVLGNCYSKLAVKHRSGQRSHDNFISKLKTLPLAEVFERSKS
tara:strand:- start:694 stop:975 length:282 start_codon:yes stop_codon:yes gene_type:complete